MRTELTLMKIKCTPDLYGKDIMISVTEKSNTDMKPIPYGEKIKGQMKYAGKHNIERHDLFWSCCALVSENTENKTPSMIAEAVKIDARFIDYYITYHDKHGNNRVNIKTKSISFYDLTLQEADEFYGKAFDILAGYINVETEKMVEEAKLKMKQVKYCPACGKRAVHKHHRFSRTSWAISKYGKGNVDAVFNIAYYCPDCHSSHRNVLKKDLWDENKFRRELNKYRGATCNI